MRAVVQRVTQGRVTIGGQVAGEIGAGLVILVGATHTDTSAEAGRLAEKIVHLRIFADDAGKMNRSLHEVNGQALVISQFTLYADARRGRRPGYTDAALPAVAAPLIAAFVAELRQAGIQHVASGVFGADMLVEIHNDGPVTIILDTASL